ncbi:MAG: ADP-ribosylglycohydrolase family protein [Chloroflexi bacterium]|nr:ADP-ribosylglycohydrolase family protein [Chloroflexota bacterium]
MTTFPPNYLERVYAGVLGKIIGVYLGRPFEGWTHERILERYGEIRYYVNDDHTPLVVTDDDISGTFTFLRALPDHNCDPNLTPEQIGQTWLNYIIENRTILWWGGLGNSTEHTAYLRLKHGIPAPRSGSMQQNSQVVAEQIGAQIFIDGWGLVCPGDPERAADFARRAASVSHDGEAIYGAQVIAAMEALAFVERDRDKLLDAALALIPTDSLIYRLIGDLRDWHTAEPDWYAARARIAAEYGYDRYPGNCHIIPNHALVVLALLYGGGDFQQSLMIANTCGWDTDCNSGNVGCLLGIMNGLDGINTGPDWRGPVADRLFLSAGDGGRAITDAAREAVFIVNTARGLAGLPPLAPKDGARFHFELPGSVQGFRLNPDSAAFARVENVAGHSQRGQRSLAVRWQEARARTIQARTPTFIQPDEMTMPGYALIASPTVYAGQTVRAGLSADAANASAVSVRLVARAYDSASLRVTVTGEPVTLPPGGDQELSWRVPQELQSWPIFAIGLQVDTREAAAGAVYLDDLTWDGAPDVLLQNPIPAAGPVAASAAWRRAWVDGVQQWELWGAESFRLTQNEGRGLISQGTADWQDYTVSADVMPSLARMVGIGARVQGLRRYYALVLCDDGKARLLKTRHDDTVLAEADFVWSGWQTYALRLDVQGARLRGWVDGRRLFDLEDTDDPLPGGGVALIVDEGHLRCPAVRVRPVEAENKG